MTSKIDILKEKVLFSTKQGNAWRLRRATETGFLRRETLNSIILMIDDDKTVLRQQLDKIKNTHNWGVFLFKKNRLGGRRST
jgi:hypothetical protein